MADTTIAVIIAVTTGFVLAGLLVIPYMAWTFRRRGELGLGHAFLAFAFLIYLMALWTYTLLPLPDQDAAWCAANAVSAPQLRPFQFVTDIVENWSGSGLSALVHNPAVQQVLFNVAFFVPLGMWCRHLLKWRAWAVVVAGFCVSLLIELTQLTGVWFLFECPYRLFDIDDLLANTAGAALGVLIAPLLRLVPGQRTTMDASAPRRVTGFRRLLGIVLDVVLTSIVGVVFTISLNALVVAVGAPVAEVSGWARASIGYWLPAVLVLLVPALVATGATPGQKIVRLRPVAVSGEAPGRVRRGIRFIVGSGGYFLLLGATVLYPVSSLTTLLVAVTLVMVWWPRDHRGLSGAASGIRVRDDREPHDGETVSI